MFFIKAGAKAAPSDNWIARRIICECAQRILRFEEIELKSFDARTRIIIQNKIEKWTRSLVRRRGVGALNKRRKRRRKHFLSSAIAPRRDKISAVSLNQSCFVIITFFTFGFLSHFQTKPGGPEWEMTAGWKTYCWLRWFKPDFVMNRNSNYLCTSRLLRFIGWIFLLYNSTLKHVGSLSWCGRVNFIGAIKVKQNQNNHVEWALNTYFKLWFSPQWPSRVSNSP